MKINEKRKANPPDSNSNKKKERKKKNKESHEIGNITIHDSIPIFYPVKYFKYPY
jgi:hypothetical protein